MECVSELDLSNFFAALVDEITSDISD